MGSNRASYQLALQKKGRLAAAQRSTSVLVRLRNDLNETNTATGWLDDRLEIRGDGFGGDEQTEIRVRHRRINFCFVFVFEVHDRPEILELSVR